jgi:hypothetical protein
MDKTLKRKIGYQPPKKTVTVLKTPVPVPNVPDQATFKDAQKGKRDKPSAGSKALAKEIMKAPVITAKQVVDWIKSHPLFKWGSMCFLIGIDKGNFARTLESADPKIKPEILTKIVAVIKQYGFTQIS